MTSHTLRHRAYLAHSPERFMFDCFSRENALVQNETNKFISF